MSYYFPLEIWEKIFYKSSVKSLVKCICVCKAWKSLITDQYFIDSHLKNSIAKSNNGNHSLFFHFYYLEKSSDRFFHSILNSDNHFSTFKSPLSHVMDLLVVGTSNGLVCCVDGSIVFDHTIIIMNPSIRRYIALPKPNNVTLTRLKPRFMEKNSLLGFGFDPKNNDFKVVELVYKAQAYPDPQVGIFSLASNEWRNISHDKALSSLFSIFIHGMGFRREQVCVKGVLHWLVRASYNNRYCRYFMLTFDLLEEIFGKLMLPRDETSKPSFLYGSNDSLVVVYATYSESFRIWVMTECGDADSWNLRYCFDARHYGGISRVLTLKCSGEVVLQRNNGEIVLLDPKKHLVKWVGHERFVSDFVGHHVESLIMINTRKGK